MYVDDNNVECAGLTFGRLPGDLFRETMDAFESETLSSGLEVVASIRLDTAGSSATTFEDAIATLELQSSLCSVAIFISMYHPDAAVLLKAAAKAGLTGTGRSWVGPGWWSATWWEEFEDVELNAAVEGSLVTATDVNTNVQAHANFSREFTAYTNVRLSPRCPQTRRYITSSWDEMQSSHSHMRCIICSHIRRMCQAKPFYPSLAHFRSPVPRVTLPSTRMVTASDRLRGTMSKTGGRLT